MKSDKVIVVLAVCGFGLIATGLVWQLASNQNWAELGQRGDFFGGILNPILSLMAFLGVLYSIYLQRTDIAEEKKDVQRQISAIEMQRFEATFFQMLGIHIEIVNSLAVRSHSREYKGRDCFSHISFFLPKRIDDKTIFGDNLRKRIQDEYKSFWSNNGHILSHYMRYLYNIVRFIDSSNIDDSTKKQFMRILRSQLSDRELLILFYNSFTYPGTSFNEYIEKYNILDNLPINLVPLEHLEFRAGLGRIGDLPPLH